MNGFKRNVLIARGVRTERSRTWCCGRSSYHTRPVSVVVGEVVVNGGRDSGGCTASRNSDAGDDLNWGARVGVLAPLSTTTEKR